MPTVAFLKTLTMVGLVTFNLEKKEFGTKFTKLVRDTIAGIETTEKKQMKFMTNY
ncbi:hypothetical protein [Tissierella sp.]|uniref:hypothetical protein n=1 Tax=Tissierella sp. TaxID=41274 RepID=UPI0028B232C2|nr:hypothetical protein [Tissierella sp.]